MDKFIFNVDDFRQFEDKFGNEFNIIVLLVEQLNKEQPDNKDFIQIRSSLNKMVEAYFTLMKKGELHGSDKKSE